MKAIDEGDKKPYTVFTTDANGTIELKGLEAGTYYLKEIATLLGYNPLTEPREITIQEKADADTDAADLKGTYGSGEKIAYEADVLNNKGTELPTTGGIGTTLFITFGMIAMLSTGVFLVTNKRISKETF